MGNPEKLFYVVQSYITANIKNSKIPWDLSLNENSLATSIDITKCLYNRIRLITAIPNIKQTTFNRGTVNAGQDGLPSW